MFTCIGINGQLWEFDAAAAGLEDPQFLGFLRMTASSDTQQTEIWGMP